MKTNDKTPKTTHAVSATVSPAHEAHAAVAALAEPNACLSVLAAPEPARSLYLQLTEPMRAKLAALRPEELVHVNADLADVAGTVLGVIPLLRELRPRVLDELPRFDIAAYDALEELARAALVMQAAHRATVATKDGLPALQTEAEALRTTLVTECRPIEARGEIPAGTLKTLKMSQGYNDTGMDLLTLAHALRLAWKAIGGRTGITLEQVANAERLGTELVVQTNQREKREALLEERGSERQRMFTLLVRTYHKARGAVTYLRWSEGDYEELAPSPFAARGAIRHEKKEAEGEEKDPSDAGTDGAKKPADVQGEKDASNGAKGTKGADGAKSAKPVDARSALERAMHPDNDEEGPMLGPDGKPLVPQDDPFAKW